MINPSIDIDERNDLDAQPEGTAEREDAERLAAWETADDEPADIDGDAGFDPYTGGPESPYEADDAGDWYGDE